MANTQGAVDRGVFGIPAFSDEQFFGKDHIEEMEWWLGNGPTEPRFPSQITVKNSDL